MHPGSVWKPPENRQVPGLMGSWGLWLKLGKMQVCLSLHRALPGQTKAVCRHLSHHLVNSRHWKNSHILSLGWNLLSWDSGV